MKKIFFLLTILISLNVLADWIFVITNTSNDYFYIDPQTIAKEGNKVRFWTKTNYNNF